MPAYRTSETVQNTAPDLTKQTYATTAQVLAAVAAAQQTQSLPPAARDQLVALSQIAKSKIGGIEEGPDNCFDERETPSTRGSASLGRCAYGDPNGTKLMVIYGDSRAAMWASTLERVAAVSGWKVRVFSRSGCPAADLRFRNNATGAPDSDCDTFHSIALEEIGKLHPQLVVTASYPRHRLAGGEMPTPAQWQDAWVSTFQKLAQPGTQMAMLGAIPTWDTSDALCLVAHLSDIQACSADPADAVSKYSEAERAAASTAGVHYVDTVPWVCAERCQPIIADTVVYYDPFRFTKQYAVYLSGAVAESLTPAMT